MRAIIIQCLRSLGLGLLIIAVLFGFTAFFTDLRLLILLGAVLFLVCAFFARASISSVWLDGILLSLPLCLIFAFFVVQQLPFLWPTFLIWLAAAFIGLFSFRGGQSKELILSSTIVLGVFSTWYCFAYVPDQMQRTMTHLGKDSAPSFELDPVSEGDVPQAATPGKILVIDFFATWCRPCKEELPELRAIRNELQDRPDIDFVVVATNAGGDTPERLRQFDKRQPIGLPLAFDPAGKVHTAFGFSGFPSLVVIDRAGQTRLRHEGYNSSEVSFHRSLVELLRSL